MSSIGLQLYEQQRTTIDYLHSLVFYAPRFQHISELQRDIDNDDVHWHTICDPSAYMYKQSEDDTGVAEVAKWLSTLPPVGYITYNRIGRISIERSEEDTPICYHGGHAYIIMDADPLMVYALGASRFYPQPTIYPAGSTHKMVSYISRGYNPEIKGTEFTKRYTDEVFKSETIKWGGQLTISCGLPVILQPVGAVESEDEFKCELASNGQLDNFLVKFNEAEPEYNMCVRPNSPLFKKMCPDKPSTTYNEYDLPSTIPSHMESRVTELAKMIEERVQAIFNISESDFTFYRGFRGKHTKYDLMFRILDLAVGLAARNIEFQIYQDDLSRTLLEIHILFIQNMPDPQGRLPFSYPRRPLSWYGTSDVGQMEYQWNVLTKPYNHDRYMATYRMYAPYIGTLTTDDKESDIISLRYMSGKLLGDNYLHNKREQESSKIFGYWMGSKGDYYRTTFRDAKMNDMKLSYWNLGIAAVSDEDLVNVPESELSKYEVGDIIYYDLEQKYSDGSRVAKILKPGADISKGRITEEDVEGVEGLDDIGIQYFTLQEEDYIQPISLGYNYITINGVAFSSRNIMLLYNTPLVTTFLSQGDQHIELPQVDHRDLRLLQSLFNGMISLLYFYENASNYMYSLLSFERTMLDIFDLKHARYFMIGNYDLGLPLREQLAGLAYSRRLGKISRLDELVEIAKTASSLT